MLALLIAGLALRLFIVLWKPEVLYIDDSFYSLGIAKNLALGHGASHDGIHVTNGYQPLYVWMFVPLYWVLRDSTNTVPLLAMTVLAFLNAAAGYFIYRIGERFIGSAAALMALTGWCLSPYVITGVNGLETSLTVFFVAATSWYYLTEIRTREPSIVSLLTLGFLLGLTILSRVDSVVFAVVIMIDLFFGRAKSTGSLRVELRNAAVIAAATGIVLAPYVISNLVWFDSVMPRSGQAIRLRSMSVDASRSSFMVVLRDDLWSAISVWWRHLGTPLNPFAASLQFRYVVLWTAATVAIVIAAYRRSADVRDMVRRSRRLVFVPIWAVALMSVYVLYQHGDWNWPRYFYPVVIPVLLWTGMVAESGLRLMGSFTRRPGLTANTLALIGLYGLSLLWSLPNDRNPIWMSPQDKNTFAQYRAAEWLAAHTDPSDRIASFQSGIVGYFSGRRVTNLDGVVNDDALPFFLSRSVDKYLAELDTDILVDWSVWVDRVNLSSYPDATKVVFDGPQPVTIVRLHAER